MIRPSDSAVRDAVQPSRVAQVLAPGHGAVEADVVRQVADMSLDVERVTQRVEPEHLGRAAGGLGEAEEHEDGRGLARTVGAEEAEHLALVDVQVQGADGESRVLLVPLLQPPGPDDHRCAGHGHRLPYRRKTRNRPMSTRTMSAMPTTPQREDVSTVVRSWMVCAW